MTEKLEFQVSAKTARLIGRENISDVSGALIELVKNGYDADADCCLVKLSIPFLGVPQRLTFSQKKLFSIRDFDEYYEIRDGEYFLRKDLNELKRQQLDNYILSLSEIFVADNGSGMTYDILSTKWMNIGTNDKEINIYSEIKKRIKTGAKGIGRFALDKLSTQSNVITKTKDTKCLEWSINWSQFDNAELLTQVKAEISEYEEDFQDTVINIFGDIANNYKWESGTIIKLSPLREFWDINNFELLCNNLRNINPYNSVDKFEVNIQNVFYPDYTFNSSVNLITENNYDYNIYAEFDGNDKIEIILKRNELDIDKEFVNIQLPDKTYRSYSLNGFWSRKAFLEKYYCRNDYAKSIKFDYYIKDVLEIKKYSDETILNLGKFSLNLFYSKNTKSTVGIVKKFNLKERKNILKNFSGIKIYRDNFKMKGYGDSGVLYDWLDLGKRATKSPAAASHQQGAWRVNPNQIFGYVSISRIDNKKLEDNANREGMAINNSYLLFIDIIHFIISKFEFDRQVPLREYAAWTDSILEPIRNKFYSIFDIIKAEKESGKHEEGDFSTQELKDTIYTLGKYRESDIATQQLLMILSSAGVLAQTFAHEISNIGTDLGSRGQLLEVSIDHLLGGKTFEGDEDFNPYKRLERLNSTDTLLSEWVQLIMDSVKPEHFIVKKSSLSDFLIYSAQLWENLLAKKMICVKNIIETEDDLIIIPEIDLHLIINNFILNSAYFLEQSQNTREIIFHLYDNSEDIILDMKNTGPELDKRYINEPDKIFEPRETTKNINGQKGTGLGLWIVREAVLRNLGEIHTIVVSNSFLIRITWKKKEIL